MLCTGARLQLVAGAIHTDACLGPAGQNQAGLDTHMCLLSCKAQLRVPSDTEADYSMSLHARHDAHVLVAARHSGTLPSGYALIQMGAGTHMSVYGCRSTEAPTLAAPLPSGTTYCVSAAGPLGCLPQSALPGLGY